MARLFHAPRLLLALLACAYALVVLTTQADWQFNGGDFPWYLNRARLIWQGELAPNWVYTFVYPFLVGGVLRVVGDGFTAAAVVTGLASIALWLGVYTLGKRFANPTVGALAVALVASNYECYFYARQLQTIVTFCAVMVWLVVAYHQLVTRPSWWAAAWLGTMVVLALYTRFEGVTYGILVPLAVWQLAASHGWRAALAWGALAMAVLTPFVLYFLPFIFGAGVTSGAQDLFFVLNKASSPQAYLAANLSGYLHAIAAQWVLPLWGVLLWFATRPNAPHALLTTFGGLAAWHLLVIVVLIPTEPNPIYFQLLMVWLSLLMAWGLWRLRERLRAWAWWSVLLAVLAIQFGTAVAARPPAAPFAFRGADNAQAAAAVDAWVRENAPERPLWTICPHIIAYSHSDLRLIYRFALFFDNPDLPDSPKHLLPIIHARGGLFLDCAVWEYGDWRAVIRDGVTYPPYRLQRVGGFSPYSFYEVVRDD